jgi:hypothetical protein
MYRKTSIGIQIILMLVIMEYYEFGNWAKVQSGFGKCLFYFIILQICLGGNFKGENLKIQK